MEQIKDERRRTSSLDYDGEERRRFSHTCFDHGKHEERMSSHGQRILDLEKSNPVPYSNFKWMIGIMFVVMLALFVVPISMYESTNDTLTDIIIKQETTIIKLEQLTKEVEEIGEVHKAEINQIHKKMNQTINEVIEHFKHPPP